MRRRFRLFLLWAAAKQEQILMPKTPVTDLSPAELEFYSRQIVLPSSGYNGQLKLRNSRVCIVGLGGLGSPAALQLAAMGVGFLRLVDFDVVELSNLQRQHLYGVNYLGYPKVEVAAKRLQQLNPNVEIEPRPVALNSRNAQDLIGDVDVVVDGLDLMAPRYAVNAACVKADVPYVFGAAITTNGSVSTILPKKTACLECFQGNVEDSQLPKCAVAGVHPSVLNVVASIEVTEAVRILLGKPPRLANKLFHCDIEELTFEEVEISKSSDCSVCSSNSSGAPSQKQQRIREICGRKGKRVFVVTPESELQLSMADLASAVEQLGFTVKVKGELGLTFVDGADQSGSVLKSGITVIEGVDSEEEAQTLTNSLLQKAEAGTKKRL
jgi:molybdopterin/thiamine biosynthesis adenylyltransferase